MTDPVRVAIVGGGIAGLSAAYFLKREAATQSIPIDIRLFEGQSHLGGLIQTKHQDGFLLEEGPDCFLTEKPLILDLIRELKLESHIIATNPLLRQSFIVRKNRLIPVPQGLYLMAPGTILPFLKSPLISPIGKLRAAMDLFLPSRNLADESLASFVKRRLGKEMFERIAQPMIAGIYAADPHTLSLRATMPHFLEMEKKFGSVIRGVRNRQSKAEHASGPRYGLFASFEKGMETLTTTLTQSLNKEEIHTDYWLKKVSYTSPALSPLSWTLDFKNTSFQANVLVLSLPPTQLSQFFQDFSPALARRCTEIPYAASSTVQFAYRKDQIKHPLDGMGFVVPAIEKMSIFGCSFSSQKFEGRAPIGSVLLRAFVGGATNERIFRLSDEEIIDTVTRELERLLTISGKPLFAHIKRWPASMPQYTLGHLDRIAEIERECLKFPGLYLAGSAYRGVGIPDIIERSKSIADTILQNAKTVQPSLTKSRVVLPVASHS